MSFTFFPPPALLSLTSKLAFSSHSSVFLKLRQKYLESEVPSEAEPTWYCLNNFLSKMGLRQTKHETVWRRDTKQSFTRGPKSRILKMAVYEVLVSVTPSVHVVLAQVQARQGKKKSQTIKILHKSEIQLSPPPKKRGLERLKKAKGP